MRADLAIETPLKFFIVLVVAALLVGLIRNIYNQKILGRRGHTAIITANLQQVMASVTDPVIPTPPSSFARRSAPPEFDNKASW